MYYPEELVEEVRSRNDIVDVISGYVKLQRKGSNYFGLCPFHNEKSPSFSVNRSKQMYYCFGCGAGGSVITFLMEYENLSFREAVKMLADRVGMELPEQELDEQAKREQGLRGRILELNKMAASYYYYCLRSERGAAGMQYLKKRQLSDETMQRFGLGFAGKSGTELYRYLKSKDVSDELLARSGLMNVDEKRGMYDKFWNRVIFPIMDVNSRVIGFGGRVMGDGKPKYLNSPETLVFDKSRNLYGLHAARKSRQKYLLVCEGYMDVISMHQAGFTNAVASLGTALTSQHAALLKRYTDEVVLTYDSDGAGVKAALRAIPMLKEAGVSAKVLSMTPYKDPDEFIKNLGAEEFQKRIDDAQNSFLFEIDTLQKNYDMQDPQSKTAFYEETAKRLMTFDSELERENYIEAVASRYGVGFENLRKLVNRTAMKQVAIPKIKVRTNAPGREKEDGIVKSQKLLLTWLIEYPSLYNIVKRYLSSEDFTTELYQIAAGLLFEQLENGEYTPAKILNHFTDPEEQREAASLFHANLPIQTEEEREKAFRETLGRLFSHSLAVRTEQLDPTDMEGLQKIIADRKRLPEIGKLQVKFQAQGQA